MAGTLFCACMGRPEMAAPCGFAGIFAQGLGRFGPYPIFSGMVRHRWPIGFCP